ncbi:MAG: hypothetical protein K1X64_12365 [Myxococcaceae bacterium]|nr:hypothetical protein [Myxococcaceae bacterium]
MWAALLLSMTVGAAKADEPVKLALPGFNFVKVEPELASFFSEHFAQKLTFEKVKVTTAADISTLLGFERQKELLGCADNAQSCIAELANALGVDGLVVGSIGKFGDNFQVNVKTLSATDGRMLCAYSTNVKGEQEVLAALDKAAASFAMQLKKQFNRTDPQRKKGGVLADAITLTTPGLKRVGIDKQLGSFLEEHLVQQFVFNKIALATPKDIATLLGQERQRQLMGCSDSSQCQADLATLMNADAVLTGQVAKLEGKFQINLKVVGATSATSLSVFAGSAQSLEALLPLINAGTKQIAAELKTKISDERALRAPMPAKSTLDGGTADAPLATTASEPKLLPAQIEPVLKTTPAPKLEKPRYRHWPFAPTIAGSALLAAGAISTIVGAAIEPNYYDDTGRDALIWGGVGGMSAGAALFMTAAIMYAVSDEPPPDAAPLPMTEPPIVNAPVAPPPNSSDFLMLDGGQ